MSDSTKDEKTHLGCILEIVGLGLPASYVEISVGRQ